MALAAETSLPEMPVEALAFSADPQPYLDAARRAHPWLARFSQGYVVHGYQAVADLLADNEHMLVGLGPIVDFYGMQGTIWARFMHEMILVQEGSSHARIRGSVAHAFTPKRANQARPMMQQVIAQLLDEWAPKGAFDFSEFASLFPVTVMCGMLGVSAEPIPNMRDALASQVNALAMIDGFKPQLLAGWETMWTFTDRLVTEREASGECDEDHLLDALIEAKRAGQLDEIELRFMLLVLLFAGFDTSKNMLSMTMMLLLERPEIYARCAEDKDYCGQVVTEALRHSGIAVPYRLVTRDFSYDGIEFRKGELLTLGTPFAGRDSAIFADPLAFDPDRENGSRHVSFGRGPHICLGQFIAKNQLQEGLHLIAQRLRNPRLDGPVEWRHFVGAWGPEKFPIAFDAA